MAGAGGGCWTRVRGGGREQVGDRRIHGGLFVEVAEEVVGRQGRRPGSRGPGRLGKSCGHVLYRIRGGLLEAAAGGDRLRSQCASGGLQRRIGVVVDLVRPGGLGGLARELGLHARGCALDLLRHHALRVVRLRGNRRRDVDRRHPRTRCRADRIQIADAPFEPRELRVQGLEVRPRLSDDARERRAHVDRFGERLELAVDRGETLGYGYHHPQGSLECPALARKMLRVNRGAGRADAHRATVPGLTP